MRDEQRKRTFREKLWRVIFEAETPAGKVFDVLLLWLIGLSVIAVILESVESVAAKYGQVLRVAEWIFTILFTLEYLLRLYAVKKPLGYAKSFYGVVDLLSCLPTYLQLLIPGAQSLLVNRILRLLRLFRILKMVGHVEGANLLLRALFASRAKITVFLFAIAALAVILGSIAYLLEAGQGGGIESIPDGIYWAVVTMTTLGYGDVTPVTVPGKMLTVVTSLTGFAIIAVPTGIFVREVMTLGKEDEDAYTEACPGCGSNGHLPDANFCRKCGEKLEHEAETA